MPPPWVWSPALKIRDFNKDHLVVKQKACVRIFYQETMGNKQFLALSEITLVLVSTSRIPTRIKLLSASSVIRGPPGMEII